MGNLMTYNFIRSSVPLKRKAILADLDVEDADVEAFLAPKKRKLVSTSKYIYKTLFEEGANSDVTVVIFNKEWKLHKIYLSQSPYFNAMFNGNWIEATMKKVDIVIEDVNITEKALHKVLGSLYQDEIQIDSSEAVSILACGALLQLEYLMEQCVEVMKSNINIDTAIQFYEAAELYGLKEVKALSLEWLHNNMVLKICTSFDHLKQISCNLMEKLILSFELIVIQTEFLLYRSLKHWIFLREDFPLPPNIPKFTEKVAENYFQTLADEPFLLTSVGLKYQKAFRALHLKSLIIHLVDFRIIEEDHIIPLDWIMPVIKLQWYQMLLVAEGIDKGPQQVSEKEFKQNCNRQGRILFSDVEYNWRWTGFNFGFDLVMHYANGSFEIQRHVKRIREHAVGSPNMGPEVKHFIMYHVKVLSLDSGGKALNKFETGIENASFIENQKKMVLKLPKCVKFPLLVHANFLLTTPSKSSEEIDYCY